MHTKNSRQFVWTKSDQMRTKNTIESFFISFYFESSPLTFLELFFHVLIFMDQNCVFEELVKKLFVSRLSLLGVTFNQFVEFLLPFQCAIDIAVFRFDFLGFEATDSGSLFKDRATILRIGLQHAVDLAAKALEHAEKARKRALSVVADAVMMRCHCPLLSRAQ